MELREVPEPRPGEGQVKIRVAGTGICGSDLHTYHDDIGIALNPPVITGHEFSGTIAEVGAGVSGWEAGERVVSELGVDSCGSCIHCRAGFPNLCGSRKSGGYWFNGAFTDFIILPASNLHRLPETVSFHEGALIEPLACVVHGALELTTVGPDDLVLITGPGAIGLAALQVAKAQGARVVIAGVSRDRERLALAEELGADTVINVIEEDWKSTIEGATSGRGADVVFECSGNEEAVNIGLQAIRKRGQFTQIGLFGKAITVNFETICYKELKVAGSLGQRKESWEKALQLVSEQKVRLKPLISHILPLKRWEEGFRIYEEGKGLKILLVPEKGLIRDDRS